MITVTPARNTHPQTIDELLASARKRLARIGAVQAASELARGALLVDTRPADQRAKGEIQGATVIDRNVLEWRLDPASPSRIAAVTGYDVRVIVICDEGYSSSLVAATLQDLGLVNATDVIGGFRAWQAAGLPTVSKLGGTPSVQHETWPNREP